VCLDKMQILLETFERDRFHPPGSERSVPGHIQLNFPVSTEMGRAKNRYIFAM
jgi:hypothetical protein